MKEEMFQKMLKAGSEFEAQIEQAATRHEKLSRSLGCEPAPRGDTIMDLALAEVCFQIDWEKLLAADDFNFTHDICGIILHIDRQEGAFRNHFLPRCRRHEATAAA